MNRLQIFAWVGVAVLQACSAGEEPSERPVDAGRDVKTTTRTDGGSADRSDAPSRDTADVSPPPNGDATPDATPPPPDDAESPDVTWPPDGTSLPDAVPPLDQGAPPSNDGSVPPDVAADLTPWPTCAVTFTVSGVQWTAPEGGADAGGTRVVRLVGDASNIGSWTPSAGVLLTETAPGTWTGTATFRDQQLTEFKFVKMDGATAEWESWTPYDSNRSLRVECVGDAGVVIDAADAKNDVISTVDAAADHPTDNDAASNDAASTDATSTDVAVDAGSSDATNEISSPEAGNADAPVGAIDAGDAGDARFVPVPAHGKSYAGVFGVRPPDATK